MIENSVGKLLDMSEILKLIIFDCLIGNSDRHHSNWGVISLRAYEDNNDIEIFFKDKMKFEALVNTKSKSAIGWKNERPIRHFELLKKLKENYCKETIPYSV